MATTLPTGGMIDPTKQAEYPVLLGDRLAAAAGTNETGSQSRLINLNYNYKTKSTSAQQRSTLARSSQSRDLYNLTITDKPPNAENTLTYVYEGSVDPARESGDADGQGQGQAQEYALVFDADRKAYILEPVSAQLNFNLRSAPAKTDKQVMEQYEQLRTLQLEDSHHSASGDDQAAAAPDGSVEEDEGPADDSNPYDFRHFLPKEGDDNGKSDTEAAPETHKSSTPVPAPATAAAAAPSKPAPKMKVRTKTQTDPLRQKKPEPKKQPPRAEPTRPAKPEPAKPEPVSEPKPSIEEKDEDEPEELVFEPAEPTDTKSSPSDTGMAALSAHKAAPSPGSNIIIDGDLIIDMGSPPPTRRTFNINPAHFSSNNTPNGEEDDDGRDDEMMDSFRMSSPAGNDEEEHEEEHEEGITPGAPDQDDDEVEDDDALAAEMEAAFEESAREEQPAATHAYQQRQYNAPSDDESEVSEEE